MKRKSTFLRMFALLALMLPWVVQAQNAKVSEYDGAAATATYSSIAGTSGATAWTQGSYVDVSMPFAMYFGENQITAGSTLRVYPDGSASFTNLADSRIAPLYYSSGYTTTATSIYTRATAQQVVVEWRKVVSGTNSYSFQLKLYPTGDIEFCYGPMTISSSINVLVGLMSSATDIFRVGGANSTNDWSDITRYTTGTATRELSNTYFPAYNTASSQGMVYTFTQPACVKPTGITATATAWNTIDVSWTVSSNGNGYEVKYSTDSDFDPATEGTSKTINNGATLTTTITGLTGSTTYYFYVRKNCSGVQSGWTEKATATTLPGCFSANMPSVAPDGVVTWTSPNELVTSYDVKYGLAGFDPESAGTAINNISGLTTTLPVASMAPASSFDVYIRTHCSASGLTTDWVGPVSFNTPCAAITISATSTINEGFEGSTCPPACWSAYVPSSANPIMHVTDNYYSGAQSFRFSSYSSADEYDQYLISPELNSANAMTVAFNYARYGSSDNIQLGYSSTGNAITDFTWMDWMTEGEGSWASYEAMVPANTKYIAIHYYGNYAYYVWVDDLTITPPPSCPKPSALTNVSHSGNSVTLSWTENGTATAWQIAYGLFTTDDDYTIVDATTNPFTVSNLGLGEWQFFVRSNCAADDKSGWIGPVSQTFGYCTPAPTSHDNNGITNVSFGNTLVVNDNSATTAATRYQNHSDMIGDFFAGTSAEVNITLDAGYSYGTKVWVDWNNDFEFSNDEQVYYELAPSTRPYIVNAVFSIPISVPLGDYRMRIGATDNDAGPDPCYTGSYGVMRDYTIRVVAAPSCFKPNSLAVSGVTTTEATLTWVEAGLSTQWEVKYGPAGFDINEGEGISVMVNTTPSLALNYLEPVKNYDVYVRAICDPEGPTEWSNMVEFSTLCPNSSETTADGTVTYTMVSGTNPDLTLTSHGAIIYDDGGPSGDYSSSQNQYLTVYPSTAGAKVHLYDPNASTEGSSWDYLIVYNGVGTSGTQLGEVRGSNVTLDVTSTDATGAVTIYFRSDGSVVRSGWAIQATEIGCDMGTCVAPQVAIALSDAEYAATLTFTDANEADNPTYGIVWGPQGFNPATSGTTVAPISANTYTISNLAATTSYDVYVYAICGSENSDTVRYGFTTPFIPNCKTPNTIAANNITYNTADLTWNQPGDVPQTWTIRYATADFDPATAAATDYELIVPGSTTPAAQLTGLVAGTTYYVYIKATCATSPVLDESPWSAVSNANPAFTFTTPECVTPTAVTASNVTNITADIAWTGNAAAYTLKYGLAGFDPETAGTEVACTTTSVQLTGLDQYATYNVYVKANCTATDESDWSAAATFRTSCPDGGDATLGNGTYTSAYVPVHYNWGNTYCQQIFTAQELTEAGMSAGPIQGISFSWYYRSSYTKEFTIYIGTTDKDEFNDNSDWITVTGDPVYGPAEFATSAAQENFAFNTPFVWDGASNIVVTTIMNQYGGSGTGGSGITAYAYDAGYNRSLYNYRDSYAFVVNDPETSGSQHKGISNYRANITFMANCNTDVTCFAPIVSAPVVAPNNNVALTWTSRTDLLPVVNNFELKYGLA
ncbi:MAG: fibronectin type III domain-containing protein, partial [Bacteroidales bacterium]|nr:fibronectin type III domain-containing protein [Bacteroidales bacterium]